MLKNEYLDTKVGVDTERALQSSLILFDFHTPQGFNFHRSIPPPFRDAIELLNSTEHTGPYDSLGECVHPPRKPAIRSYQSIFSVLSNLRVTELV